MNELTTGGVPEAAEQTNSPATDDESDRSEAEQWVLARLRDRTESTPDGKQNVESNVWTSTRRLKSDSRKTDALERDGVAGIVEALRAKGDLISWHGLIAPSDREHVQAIIANENRSNAPRKILIERARSALRAEQEAK